MPRNITDVATSLFAKQEQRQLAIEHLSAFTPTLYDALERHIAKLIKLGVATVSPPSRTKTDDGRECLSFEWNEDRIILIPAQETARMAVDGPELRERLRVYAEQPTARLAVFCQPKDDPNVGRAIHDFYIHPEGSCSAKGIGWVIRARPITEPAIGQIAVDFLDALAKDFDLIWRERCELPFSKEAAGFRAPMGFVKG